LLGKKKAFRISNAGSWTRRKLEGEITQVAMDKTKTCIENAGFWTRRNLYRSNAGFWTRRKLAGQVLEIDGQKRLRVFLVYCIWTY
jgi:hypothetical protein